MTHKSYEVNCYQAKVGLTLQNLLSFCKIIVYCIFTGHITIIGKIPLARCYQTRIPVQRLGFKIILEEREALRTAAQPHELAPANFNLYSNWNHQLVLLRVVFHSSCQALPAILVKVSLLLMCQFCQARDSLSQNTLVMNALGFLYT